VKDIQLRNQIIGTISFRKGPWCLWLVWEKTAKSLSKRYWVSNWDNEL